MTDPRPVMMTTEEFMKATAQGVQRTPLSPQARRIARLRAMYARRRELREMRRKLDYLHAWGLL